MNDGKGFEREAIEILLRIAARDPRFRVESFIGGPVDGYGMDVKVVRDDGIEYRIDLCTNAETKLAKLYRRGGNKMVNCIISRRMVDMFRSGMISFQELLDGGCRMYDLV